ncbi:hypothetical protein C8Q70DRAFT_934275 [Cubamyces menziesii]|nr:hypothetical protein C8Q70DRAFT_934275 [Cubamyces menziesii]
MTEYRDLRYRMVQLRAEDIVWTAPPQSPRDLGAKSHASPAYLHAYVLSMLVQLISILHGQTKLPTLFRAVGFLWKVNVLFGQELPLALDSMPCTVEAEKKGLNSEGGVEREREIYARCLKRIQYYHLPRPSAGHRARTLPAPPELRVPLRAFTTLRVWQLLDLTLPLVADPSFLSSLLTPLTYCATSFARIGLDFRAALGPFFVFAVRRGVTRGFDDATNAWSTTLESDDTAECCSRLVSEE